MARKQFDAKLYNDNDQQARLWVRKYLPEGYVAVDNDKRTGVDIQVFKDDKHIFNIEPEIKRVWSGPFKYKTIHLPMRKSKYCYLDEPTLFIIFRSDGEEYFCFWDKIILANGETKEIHNKYVQSGELFFDLPISFAKRSIAVALRQRWQQRENI